MFGTHRRVLTSITPARVGPALCAVGLAGLLIGATAAVLHLGAVSHTADRDVRPVAAGSSGSPRATSHPTPPPGTGAVVSSGSCQASFYSDGQHTADGEVFDPNAFTAAHKTLPFNTRVRVTNKNNGQSVVVRINDRGPFVTGRCLDLSRAAFAAIASVSSGVIMVSYAVLS